MRRLFLILIMLPLPALAADEKPVPEWVQALCSVGGQTVYMAEKPTAEATDMWRDKLVASHPTGVCIFKVRAGEDGGYEYGSLKAPEPPHVVVAAPEPVPGPTFPGVSPGSSSADSDPLATALKLLGSNQTIGATEGTGDIPAEILQIINASPSEMPDLAPLPLSRGEVPAGEVEALVPDPGLEQTSPDQTAALPRYPVATADQIRSAVLRSVMTQKIKEAQEAERARAERQTQHWRFATEEDIRRIQEDETRRMTEELRRRKTASGG